MKTYNHGTPEISLRKKNGDMKTAQIRSSKDMYDYFKELFDGDVLEVYESCFAIYLNQSKKTVGWIRISQGGITGTVIDLRLVFKGAIECLATSLILAHNHPSGNLTPSDADIKLTERIKAAGDIMEIKLIDHIILSPDGYYSFADEGKI